MDYIKHLKLHRVLIRDEKIGNNLYLAVFLFNYNPYGKLFNKINIIDSDELTLLRWKMHTNCTILSKTYDHHRYNTIVTIKYSLENMPLSA